MKIVSLILCIVLFIISIGSINKHRKKNPDSIAESSFKGKLLLFICTLLPFITLIISVSTLFDLKWYWSLIISFIGIFFLQDGLSTLYCSIFGYKTKPHLSLFEGKMVRYNMQIVDAVITFVIGLILLLVTI